MKSSHFFRGPTASDEAVDGRKNDDQRANTSAGAVVVPMHEKFRSRISRVLDRRRTVRGMIFKI